MSSKQVLVPPGVILINPKYGHNVASTIRACSCFDVKSMVWTGSRVNPSEYDRLPREERMKGYRSVEWQVSDKPIDLFPGAETVCVEVWEGSEPLTTFDHPENAVYVFGPEDGSVPQVIRRLCHRFVHIPARHCLNLAAAVNVVLFDRLTKRQRNGLEPILPIGEFLNETRGYVDQSGWDGK